MNPSPEPKPRPHPRRTWYLAIALATVVVLGGGYYAFYRWWYLPGIRGKAKLGFASFDKPPEWSHPIFGPAVWIDYGLHVRKTKRYLEGDWTDSTTGLTIEWMRLSSGEAGGGELDWAHCVLETPGTRLDTEYYTWRDRLWRPGHPAAAKSIPPSVTLITPRKITERTPRLAPARVACQRMSAKAPGYLPSLTLWPEIWDGSGDPPSTNGVVDFAIPSIPIIQEDMLIIHPWPRGAPLPVIAPPGAYPLNRDRLIVEIHPSTKKNNAARALRIPRPQPQTLVFERAEPESPARDTARKKAAP